MRKKDTLYKANKYNRVLFSDIDRVHQNIFDGLNSSYLDNATGYNPGSTIKGSSAVIGLKPLTFNFDMSKASDRAMALANTASTVNQYKDYSNNLVNNTGKQGLNDALVPAMGALGYMGAKAAGVGTAKLASKGLMGFLNNAAGKFGNLLGANNLSAAAGAGIGVAGAVGNILGHKLISDGFNTGTGDTVATVGNMVGSGLSMINPIVGALVSAGTGIIGGGINRTFGVKTNQERLNAAKQGINYFSNYDTNAGSMDSIQDIQSYSLRNPYTGGWAAKGKARRKWDTLKKEFNSAEGIAYRGRDNNIFNLNKDNIANYLGSWYDEGGPLNTASSAGIDALSVKPTNVNADPFLDIKLSEKDYTSDYNNSVNNILGNVQSNMLGNYKADGGTLFDTNNMGAINYGFMSDYLANKTKQAEQKNQMTNMFMGTPSSFFDFGGDLQTHGADFGTGLTHIDAGQSHELNPNDGVQMGVDRNGTPNLVEEGETVYDDYVFSNRIYADGGTLKKFRLPKKAKLTYAEISKRLEKEIKEHPNDPISKAGFKAQMEQLEEQQERQKQEMEAERAKAAFNALSPEEQTALMQRTAQEEAMAQQAAQQQTMAEQQQPAPEEAAMMQQQMMGEQPMSQPEVLHGEGGGIVRGENGLIDYDKTNIELPELIVSGKKKKAKKQTELPTITATRSEILAGLNAMQHQEALEEIAQAIQEKNQLEDEKGRTRIHYYDKGGELKHEIYSRLGRATDSDFKKWLEEMGGGKLDYETIKGLIEKGDLETLKKNQDFIKAIAKEDRGLAHSITLGNNFGLFTPDKDGIVFTDPDKGNWDAQLLKGWDGSNDDAWLELVKKWEKDYGKNWRETVGKFDTKRMEKEFRGTKAYQNTTEWLKKDPENVRRYLNSVLQTTSSNSARNHALQFVNEDGTWKDSNKIPTYAQVFGENGKGVRETYPGTYWHSVKETNRGTRNENYLLNEDGTVEIIPGTTEGLTAAGTHSWQGDTDDWTVNYFTRPMEKVTDPEAATTEAQTTDASGDIEGKNKPPKLRKEWPRYLGLLGPAVGLGLMGAGVGRPDLSGLSAAVSSAGTPHLADYKPLGNYITYRPMDIWYQQNALNAQARATDRALQNTINPSKAAGLLASGYNSQLASGNLYRQALEYNDALNKQVQEFNRGTDQFNADAYNRTSQFNADALNRGRQLNAQLQMQAAKEKMDADAGWYNSLYGNISGLFKGLSDLGRENAQWNMIARGAADGVYGNLGDSYTGKKVLKGAKGGKLKRKKGLTY